MHNRLSGLFFTLAFLLMLAACSPAAGESGDAGRGIGAGQVDATTTGPTAPAAVENPAGSDVATEAAVATEAGAAETLAAAVASGIAATLEAQPTAAPASPTTAPPTTTATATAMATTTPRPSATATATPTATPCQWALTADINAYIRGGPAEVYDILGSLTAGDTTAIIGRDASASWWVISFNGRDGWVANSIVSVNECPADVPEITPPSTPTPTTTPTPLPTATSAYNPPPLISEVEIIRKDDVDYPSSGHCDRATRFTVTGLVSDASGVQVVRLRWVVQDFIYEDFRGPEEAIFWPAGDPQFNQAVMALSNNLDSTGQNLVGRYEHVFFVPYPQEYGIYDPVINDTDYVFRWVFWSITAVDHAGKITFHEGLAQKMVSCRYQ